jgi:glycosyltransferase 2 family protein
MRPGPDPRRKTLRSTFRLIVGIVVSVACLYFATRGADWNEVTTALGRANLGWTIAIVLVSLFTYYLRAQRWRVLLRVVGGVPLWPAMSATVIGFGASVVLPLRLGEILRPALLSRHTSVRMSAALSSVVLERLFDMLIVILLFLAVVFAYPIPSYLQRSAAVLAGLAVTGFGTLFVMERHRAATELLIQRILSRVPTRVAQAIWPLIHGLLDGLSGVAEGSTVALVLGYSLYLWVAISVTYLMSFLALGIEVPLVQASLTTMVLVAAFVFLPQAPGFLGTWQAACVLALDLFHVPHGEAVAFAFFTWVLQMSVNVGFAGYFVAREDLSLGQLLRASTRETPAAGAEG